MKKYIKWIIGAVIILAVCGVMPLLIGSKGTVKTDDIAAYVVKRGELVISVTESGSIMALNSIDIKSDVDWMTKIIQIVDEGTVISPNDVNTMVLVQLDSANIEKNLTQQEVQYLNSEAALTEAKESRDIQIKQNESDRQIKVKELRFAMIDLRKYLGEKVADKLLAHLKNSNSYDPDFIAGLIDDEELGGEGSQKFHDFGDKITLAEAGYSKSVDKLGWTEKLAKKGYVSQMELRGEQLDVNSLEVQLEQAKVALELFRRYEFPKQTEDLLSKFSQAEFELVRTEAQSRSKLAQAEAKFASNKASFALQKSLLEKLQEQLKSCKIVAPAMGQVVYASSTDRYSRQNGRTIEIGQDIHQRQKIISIPDSSVMKVEVKIHETWIDKIKIGQKAKITMAAFPDKKFNGEVIRKAPMADPENWLNPDIKVYTTDIRMDGNHTSLKTGMTAKAEIIIEELSGVLNVPIQCVINHEGKKFCFVKQSDTAKKTEVQTGQFNDNFVVIISGVGEGDKVLLNPPRIANEEK